MAFSYPPPVIHVAPDYATLRAQRIETFVEEWNAFRADHPELELRAYDVQSVQASPAVIALRTAAYGDFYFGNLINDLARAAVLVDYAVGEDLDLHGLDTRTPAHPDGVIRQPGENDTDYRARIIEARRGVSAAGPDDWWLTHARAADARVRSIGIDYRGMGDLRIYLLSRENGGIPDQAMLEAVSERLNRPNVRPRTAFPTVASAIIAEVDVVARMTLLPGTVRERLNEFKLAALAAHNNAQALDTDLTHHYLRRLLDAPDVYSIEIVSPTADLVAAPERAYAIRSIDLQFAGYAR